MARDYAKQRRTPSKKAKTGKAASRKKAAPTHHATSPWRWYGAGLLSGVFISFIAYMATLPAGPGAGSDETVLGEPEPKPVPKPRFDFYTLLPERKIEVDVDPAEVTQTRTSTESETYLLQAGSFRQRDDADRRRAELLLLGLDPTVEETNGDNGQWFRVYVGPFTSRSAMAKARSLTAAQDIDTLLLKRGTP